MRIGKNVETGEAVEFSDDKSHRKLVCGKTGSGKSYTMGVLLEELSDRTDVISVVVDPQGIFWTMVNPNKSQETELWEWNLTPRNHRVNLMVPGNAVERYGSEAIVTKLTDMGVKISSIKVNPYDLSNEMWCDLFDLDITDLMGACLHKAVRSARSSLGKNFMIPDVVKEVEKQKANERTIEAVLRKLDIAAEWGVFQDVEYKEIEELFDADAINVVDLGMLDQSRYGLRNLVVAVIAKFIFSERTRSRRMEALGLGSQMKKVWLAVDEAHNFCPSVKSSLSKEILIRWAKEGRQPGLSMIVASQQPSAIDHEILSQCDVRIIHKLTNKEDIKAINALSEDFVGKDIEFYIKKLSHVGEAIVIDDQKERLDIVRIRPRRSEHGGWGA